MLHREASPFLLIFFFTDKAEQKLDKRKQTGIKKAVHKRYIVNCLWAILGLNQGPPDYESVALTN